MSHANCAWQLGPPAVRGSDVAWRPRIRSGILARAARGRARARPSVRRVPGARLGSTRCRSSTRGVQVLCTPRAVGSTRVDRTGTPYG